MQSKSIGYSTSYLVYTILYSAYPHTIKLRIIGLQVRALPGA